MRRRVLVAVEEPLRGQLATVLRGSGHVVTEAADDAAALSLAEGCEVAFVELALPRRNGYRLASALRPLMAKVPLVIGIASEIAPPPPDALACGIACVFVRPIELPQIVSVVDRWNPQP